MHNKEKLYSYHTKKAPLFPTVLILRSSDWDKCLLLNQPQWKGAKCPFCKWTPLSYRTLRENLIKAETSVWTCSDIPRLVLRYACLLSYFSPNFSIMLVFGGVEEIKCCLTLEKMCICPYYIYHFDQWYFLMERASLTCGILFSSVKHVEKYTSQVNTKGFS